MKVKDVYNIKEFKVLVMDNGEYYLKVDLNTPGRENEPQRAIIKISGDKFIYEKDGINKNANKLRW